MKFIFHYIRDISTDVCGSLDIILHCSIVLLIFGKLLRSPVSKEINYIC